MSENKIPYKIYLSEDEIPKSWYNVRAYMKNKPAPLLNPGTMQPMTAEELGGVFCEDLVKQELDNDALQTNALANACGVSAGSSAKSTRPSPWSRRVRYQRSSGAGARQAMISRYAPSAKTINALCEVRPGCCPPTIT